MEPSKFCRNAKTAPHNDCQSLTIYNWNYCNILSINSVQLHIWTIFAGSQLETLVWAGFRKWGMSSNSYFWYSFKIICIKFMKYSYLVRLPRTNMLQCHGNTKEVGGGSDSGSSASSTLISLRWHFPFLTFIFLTIIFSYLWIEVGADTCFHHQK